MMLVCHDDGVSGLKHVLSWLQIPEHFQLGGIANLDPCPPYTGRVERSPDLVHDESFETLGVHHDDGLRHGIADLHAPEALADEMEPQVIGVQFAGTHPIAHDEHVCTKYLATAR